MIKEDLVAERIAIDSYREIDRLPRRGGPDHAPHDGGDPREGGGARRRPREPARGPRRPASSHGARTVERRDQLRAGQRAGRAFLGARSARRSSTSPCSTSATSRRSATSAYNKSTGKEVPWDDVVKGYEYEDDKYVVLSDEDFRRANPEASKTVDILAFVDARGHPAALLRDALLPRPGQARREGLRAAARRDGARPARPASPRVVIRTKQYLAAVRAAGRRAGPEHAALRRRAEGRRGARRCPRS